MSDGAVTLAAGASRGLGAATVAQQRGLLAELAADSDVDASRIALIDALSGVAMTYGDLRAAVALGAAALRPGTRSLAFLHARNDVATVLALLALREAGHVVALIDSTLDGDSLDALMASYRPELVVQSEPPNNAAPACNVESVVVGAYTVFVQRRASSSHSPLHPALAVCLATSGSTGSPKFVRLSQRALVANACAITTALAITASDRAITCLPLHYAYGLSLLTSHLAAGASIVVTPDGFMSREFWRTVAAHAVTSLAGVPYGYEMLARLDPNRTVPACVRVMTQAGGKLGDALVCTMSDFMHRRQGRFHVMYGQTEATARIAVMPDAWLPERLGAVGRSVPGGTLEVHDDDGVRLDPGSTGEIVYRGPNVMLGYATARADLALGDSQGGVLRTGDIGRVDADGCLYITGRSKRMGKLFGTRVDLDAVERLADADTPVAVVEGPDRLILFAATADVAQLNALKVRIATRLKVQQRVIDVRSVDLIPRTGAGKVDYPRLRACV